MSAEHEVLADEPVRLKIEHRAYAIWESEGSPNGGDVDHWLRAEAEVASSEPESESGPNPTSTKKTA